MQVRIRDAVWRAATMLLAAIFAGPEVVSLAAELEYPLAIVAGNAGEVFLVDRNVPGVWKATDGTLELFFQGEKKFRTPLNAPRCIAVDAEGRILVGDTSTRQVYRFNAEGKPEALLTGLGIGMPMSIAINKAGEILVADLELHRIWKVPAAGGEAALFVEIAAPRGLCIDSQDRLWVVSHGKNQLVRVAPDGAIEPIVKERTFNFAHNVVVDAEFNAYVIDGYEKAIWKIPPEGKPEKLVEGEPFKNPVGLARRGDDLLVADPHAKAVFQVSKDGKVTRLELMPKP